MRERLRELLGELEPYAASLGCGAELATAGELIDSNGAIRQRAVAAERGLGGLVEWLRGRFTG